MTEQPEAQPLEPGPPAGLPEPEVAPAAGEAAGPALFQLVATAEAEVVRTTPEDFDEEGNLIEKDDEESA